MSPENLAWWAAYHECQVAGLVNDCGMQTNAQFGIYTAPGTGIGGLRGCYSFNTDCIRHSGMSPCGDLTYNSQGQASYGNQSCPSNTLFWIVAAVAGVALLVHNNK
jgi:hypothetical protein